MAINDETAYFYRQQAKQPGKLYDQFGATLVAQRRPIVELNSSYGTSLIRDRETTAGTGAVAKDTTGEIKVSTGATASSSATLEANARGRYIPGYGAEIGIGVRFDSVPTGEQNATWGAFSIGDVDGINFGYDATGPYVAYTRDSTETKVYQDSWNLDKLDGTGTSGQTLDMSEGNIFQVKFTWYGYGQILFGVVNRPLVLTGIIAGSALGVTAYFTLGWFTLGWGVS